MEKERSHVTERMLDLTLEIIYLRTGENYIAFKLSDGLVASNMMKIQNPIIEPPSHSMRKDKKVKDATQKMIELLTGEVPIRICVKDGKDLRQKDLEKDVFIVNQPSLTSSDGSSNKNLPERCPCHLYSQDSTQEHQKIPQEDQVPLEVNQIVCKTEVKEEVEDLYVIGDDPYEDEGEGPPEISTESGDTQKEVEDEEEEGHVKIKEEEFFIEIGTDGQQFTDNKEEHSIIFPEDTNYLTLSYPGEDHLSPNFHPSHPLSNHSKPGDNLLHLPPPVIHHAGHEKFLCNVCGKNFTRKESLTLHQKSHAGEKPHSCSVCGKCFLRKWCLINHKRTHTGEKPFSCTECGKHFMHKSNLVFHQRTHTSCPPTDPHKPYSCSECGKCFKANASLLLHQRTHTGVKPYSCSECGKCFTTSSALVNHRRTHTGEKPFSCSD